MDRMPNPKRPIIELTPRVQLMAAVIILALSAAVGSMVATADAPRQQRFGRNFAAPLLIVPTTPAPVTPAMPATPQTSAPPAARPPANFSAI